VRVEDETVWLSQKLPVELFQKDVRTINEHIKSIYAEGELEPKAAIRKFRIVQTEVSKDFFSIAQNKMHWAANGHTAAKPNMSLTSWPGKKQHWIDADERRGTGGKSFKKKLDFDLMMNKDRKPRRSSWPKVKFNNVAEIKHGFAFKSSFFSNNGKYVLLTPGNFIESGGFKWLGEKQKYYSGDIPKEYILEKHDMLVAMTEQAPGLLECAILIPESDKYLHNQRLGLVTLKSTQLSKLFLFYLFNSRFVRKDISRTSDGTKVEHTSPDKIGNICIPLPPLAHQTAITEIFSTWDIAINQTVKIITAKKNRKKALMQKLLMGKERLPGFQQKKGRKTYRFFDLPADWECPSVREIAKERSERNGGNNKVTVLSCSKHKGFIESSQYFGKQVFSEDTSNYKIIRRRWFGYPSNHIEEGSIGLLSEHDIGIVSPIYTVFECSNKVVPDYLHALFKTDTFRHIFAISTNASVDRRGSLRWRMFSLIRAPLPGKDEQQAIANVLAEADNEIGDLEKKLKALEKQKRGLMQKLLTGEVRVKI
jgi:type I restriction enzyme S subunit